MSFFQSNEYHDLMKGLPGMEPFIIYNNTLSANQEIDLVGSIQAHKSLIKQLFSKHILIREEPPLLNNQSITLESFDWQFRQYGGHHSIFTEIRLLEPPRNEIPLNRINKVYIKIYHNILIDTTLSTDQLFGNLNTAKKRQVTSSLKAGAFVRKAESEKEVDILYDILSSLYRKKVRKPLLPLEVFRRFFQDKTLGEIFVVIFNNNIVGGIVCPVYQKEEMYEWYITGSDEAMKKERVYPSVLATWEAIRYASVNGYKRFNFMGAGLPDQPYGVRDFKLQFGGQLVEAPRYYIIHKPILFRLGKLAIKLGLGNL